MLTRASPVFKAMLAPKFKGGAALATNASVEIPLPDDDPRLLLVLCKVIHLSYGDDMPATMPEKDILAMAQLCDKYACTPVLRPFFHAWVVGALPSANHDDRLILLEAAVIIGVDSITKSIVVDMVFHSTRDDCVSLGIRTAINNLMWSFQKIMDNCVQWWMDQPRCGGCQKDCRVGMLRANTILTTLQECGIWPLSNSSLTIGQMCAKVKHIRLRDALPLVRCASNDGCVLDKADQDMSETERLFAEWAEWIAKVIADMELN
ncbi:hypothetical protein LTR62_004163 [Meristemomyces frigidus]|uniref:BTB domain-containing protein n=1 Tax=Meristemomyces frigidus TaxID=1508187 RepID=A0AAN7YJN2_9PEZI|nr:hypothetical protein LTR62_004163 [Meristemomyces frigidus]